MDPTLRELSENEALGLILNGRVTHVEVFPSKDIGATIIRYDDGKVVWVKFKKDETGVFLNKWYVPVNANTRVPASSFIADPPPSDEDRVRSIADEVDEDTGESYEAAMNGETTTERRIAVEPPLPDEYINIRDLDVVNDPVARRALQYVSQNELLAGKVKRSALERARVEINPAVVVSGGPVPSVATTNASPSTTPKRQRSRPKS